VAGFTLIEMIVVVVVIGLVLSLFIQRGPMRSPALEARAAANEVAESLRLARSRAIFANGPWPSPSTSQRIASASTVLGRVFCPRRSRCR
jgi:prepilin-type N-terminal cleavage/methylation domain-containing protein